MGPLRVYQADIAELYHFGHQRGEGVVATEVGHQPVNLTGYWLVIAWEEAAEGSGSLETKTLGPWYRTYQAQAAMEVLEEVRQYAAIGGFDSRVVFVWL